MKHPFFLILVLFSYFSVSSFGQQQQPPQQISGNNQPPAEARNNETNDAPAPEQADTNQDEAKAQIAATVQEAASDWWIERFTGALVFIGITQAAVYAIQCFFMKKAIDQSRESAERQLRAYVSLANFSHEAAAFSPNIPHKFPSSFDILLKNTGQTPAYNVHCFMDWITVRGKNSHWIEGTEGFSEVRIQALTQIQRGSQFVLGSGELTKLDQGLIDHNDGGTFADAMTKMQAGSVTIFLYGVVLYDDIFTKNHPTDRQTTRFCFQLYRSDNNDLGYRTYDRHHDVT